MLESTAASLVCPIAVLDADLRLIGANPEFYRAFGTATEPLEASLAALLDITAARDFRTVMQAVIAQGQACEAIVSTESGRKDRTLLLAPGYKRDTAGGQSLLVIEDTTDRGHAMQVLAERLERSELMMEEMRHRVANSLQIIASVVRIKTHLVQSADARSHLEDVHQRVLSIAALQDQLDATDEATAGSVSQYLGAVCLRLANSLIDPATGIELRVAADDLSVRPEVCVGIGLVVTELVTNALKHAFPAQARGVIRVAFTVRDSGWQLSVADDGVGCDLRLPARTGGVGTRIVSTLARRLGARLEVSSNEPHGLIVTLTRHPDAPVVA